MDFLFQLGTILIIFKTMSLRMKCTTPAEKLLLTFNHPYWEWLVLTFVH